MADGGTIITRRSARNFQTLEDCVEDAGKHGYVLHVPAAARSAVEPAERAESTQSPGTLAGSAPANAIDPIAIYIDAEGNIIIRQQHAARPIESVIIIPSQHAYSVIEGIKRQTKGSFVTPRAVAGGA